MNPRTSLLLLAAVCVLPLLASTLLFVYGPKPAATTNRGLLIDPPVALAAGLFSDAQRRRMSEDSIWHLAAVGPADCKDQFCRARLCMIHQARLVRIGSLPRIGLLWLASGDANPPARLYAAPDCGRKLPASQISGLDPVDILADTRIFRAGQLPPPLAEEGIFIIDPQGRAMMRYGDDAQVADIAKDLGRLLRLSRRG